MSRAISPSSGRRYGVALVCAQWSVIRSSYYAAQARERRSPEKLGRRRPKSCLSDEELTERIREVLTGSPFVGEGHRKVWARLRVEGIRTSKGRCLRLMRQAGLLSPGRPVRELGPRVHEGSIITERPNEMWGTDATSALTTEEGPATIFVAVDHCNHEGVGIHAAKVGNRFEALEPIRQGVRSHFGGFEQAIAAGLRLRHDHGSQYRAMPFRRRSPFWGSSRARLLCERRRGTGVRSGSSARSRSSCFG